MGRMILVEGLDLAGKSTLVEGLSRHFLSLAVDVNCANGQFCQGNPSAAVARHLVRWDEGFSGVEAGSIFLSSMLWDHRHFQPVGPERVHLQDSCWLRTLAFEQLFGSATLAKLMEEQGQRFPRFDFAVMLTASLEVRQRRFQARAENDLHDLMAFRKPEKFLAIEARLSELVREWEVGLSICTDSKTPEQVLQEVLAHPRFPHRVPALPQAS
jgi:thymidylate kinase